MFHAVPERLSGTSGDALRADRSAPEVPDCRTAHNVLCAAQNVSYLVRSMWRIKNFCVPRVGRALEGRGESKFGSDPIPFLVPASIHPSIHLPLWGGEAPTHHLFLPLEVNLFEAEGRKKGRKGEKKNKNGAIQCRIARTQSVSDCPPLHMFLSEQNIFF